jgi:putative endonuclease
MLARFIFAAVDFAARKGLASEPASESSSKLTARRTGIRGETYAYWYLRRHGYTLVARNYTVPGTKGEIDLIGYDGAVLAFVEVKTRVQSGKDQPTPESAVHSEKRGHLHRMARQFMRARRLENVFCRFDVIAIETAPGARPTVRLHKGAFVPSA